MARRWTIKSRDKLLLEEVDDFLCCYCVATGRTHILDAFPAELLRQLSEEALTSQELADAVALQVGDDDASEWLASVDPILSELEGLHLVEQEAG